MELKQYLKETYSFISKGKKATEMQKKKICAVYGESVVTDRTCQKWFAKFRVRDFLLNDSPWSGKPNEVDSNQIETN